jgi:hypothetical protein
VYDVDLHPGVDQPLGHPVLAAKRLYIETLLVGVAPSPEIQDHLDGCLALVPEPAERIA